LLVVAGHSGAGKTTLLAGLITHLLGQGLRVGAIKHDPKGHAAYDHPGKDSWRYRHAGAAAVALSGPTTVAVYTAVRHDTPLWELAGQVAAGSPLDLILAEGYNDEPGVPKLEVYRPALGRPMRCPPSELLAVVTDSVQPVATGVAHLPLNDVPAVATFVVQRLVTGRARRASLGALPDHRWQHSPSRR
jgi:molybdopterin-guanine dinucleotide biosynthesis protein B